MSTFSYERYDRRSSTRRSTFTYWVPLAITATVAAGGLAAWVWSARSDHESSSSSDDEYLSYGEESDNKRGVQAGASSSRPPSYGVSEGVIREESRDVRSEEQSNTFIGRMSGALRRSPSPQQILDGASKRVAAGVAAAGAAVGSALSAIREEDGHYEDHKRWNEESETKNVTATSAESSRAVESHTESFNNSVRAGSSAAPTPRNAPSGKRKTVALVVSAESLLGSLDDDEHRSGYKTEDATLLSHLPPIDSNRTNLLVLIYSPKSRAPSSTGGDRPSSLSSSYAAINTPAVTPGEELTSLDPQPYSESNNELYDLLSKQATRMVEKPTNVMSFNTPTGYTHMLKHLAPETVYIVDSLAGERGANIESIKGWVGQVVVVVGGEGTGLGGLIDTEDEGEGRGKLPRREQWWEHSDMVGLGKGVEVVDGVKFADDWERRVGGRD